jgi:hypothetical protein
MSLFFDVINNGKLLPLGSKSYTSNNAIFNSTLSDVFIGFYPNNCNLYDFDNYNNNINIGASNLNNYYEAYIGTTNNKLIKFNDYNVITNVDIVSSNNSLGNAENNFSSISLSSNIYLNKLEIKAISSNIFIVNDLLINNLNILNNLFTNLLTSSNLITNNLDVNNIYTSNILTSYLSSSNINVYNNIISYNNTLTYYISANNINTNLIYSSNIIIYTNLFTSNLNNNSINSKYIISSNISNIENLITSSLNILSNMSFKNVTINSDIKPYIHDTYHIGSHNNRFSNLYLYDSVISDNNVLSTSLSNIIINSNFNFTNAYIYSINTNTLTVNNINTSNKNYFNNILTNNIYTNIIIASNVSVLNTIITKKILNKNLYGTNMLSSNINILGITTGNNIITNVINNSSVIYASNYTVNNIIAFDIIIPFSSTKINKLTVGNVFCAYDNKIDIGNSNILWKSLYISSNIFLGNNIISVDNLSNIYLKNNLNNFNTFTSNILTNIAIASNIFVSSIFRSSNINVSANIDTNTLTSSNIMNYQNVDTNTLSNLLNTHTNYLNTSNIIINYLTSGNKFNTSNLNATIIYSSSLLTNSNIHTNNINVLESAYINKLIVPENLSPSQCNIYKLGNQNNKWNNIYSSNIYINSNLLSSNNILDSANHYSSLNINNFSLFNTTNNMRSYIYIDSNNKLSINSSNINRKILSYSNIIYKPDYKSCNFIFTNIITSNNAYFYNTLSINTTNITNNLNVNGSILANNFISQKYIGNGLNISNISAKNIIGNLAGSNGAIIIPNINFVNNNLSSDLIKTFNINSKYYGDGYNISNIISSNLSNTLHSYLSGTGCNLINKNYIMVGNNSNPIIISSNLTFDNINNVMNIVNGTIIANNITTNVLIINSNIFYGNASNISRIVSSNITLVINNSILNNIYSNIILENNNLKINGNLYASNILSSYSGNGLNISNIIASNILDIFNVSQGGINNTIIGLSTSSWNNNILKATNIYNTSSLRGIKFTGNAQNISNITANKIIKVTNVINGGFSNNNFNLNEIVFFDNISNTSKNFYTKDLNLIINGTLLANNIKGSFISSGHNLSNINAANFISSNNIITGGTNKNNFTKTNILFSDSISINNSSNLYINDKLNINGKLIANSLYSVTYNGNARNISNIYVSNFTNNYIIAINKGGLGLNTIDYGNLLIGNNTNNILSTPELRYYNLVFYSKKIITTTSKLTIVYAPKINANKFIGDSKNLSNINCPNVNGIIPLIKGGTSLSYINKDQVLLNSNISWNNNNLIINGKIYSSKIYSKFDNSLSAYTNISNIISSNIINKISSIGSTGGNGGLANYINFYSNFTYDNVNKILTIKDGNINANKIYGRYDGDATNISNIIASNIPNTVIPNNLLKDYLFGTSNIIVNQNVTSVKVNSNIYSDIIYGIYKGDGNSISNIISSKLLSSPIRINQGGLNCNIINTNHVLYGFGASISSTNNLYFNNNLLNIKGGLINTKNIYGKYNGDATNISNIQATYFKPIYNNHSEYYVNYYSNFKWNNNTLNIIGNIYAKNIITKNSLSGDGANISNLCSSNILSRLFLYDNVITINNLSNIYWNNLTNSLYISNKVHGTSNYGYYIGNGNNISNINSKNISSSVIGYNGGTSLNALTANNVLIGNSNTILMTNNLLWNNDSLLIDGNLVSKNIIGTIKFIGSGNNISNINANNVFKGFITISQGGFGCNNIETNNIIVGNDKNPIIISPNLSWESDKNILTTINILTKSIKANYFIGNSPNISNIVSSNIIDKVNSINGVFGCNIIPSSRILIGNLSNVIITSENLLFKDNLFSLNLNTSSLYNNYIYAKNIYTNVSRFNRLIGDAKNISNIAANKIITAPNSNLPIINGGINNDILLSNYLYWDIINILKINGNIYANSINAAKFYGDGVQTSNINSSNIINPVGLLNGGFGCNNINNTNLLIGNNNTIVTTNDLSYNNKTFIINGNIIANNYYGSAFYFVTSNNYTAGSNNFTYLFASNMDSKKSVNTYGRIYYGNNDEKLANSSNLYWNINNNSLNISNYIYVSNLNNINAYWNASNLNTSINVLKGGLNLNSYTNIYGRIFYGNNNSVEFTSNLLWNSNNILITSNIYAANTKGILYGDGYNISNIKATSLYNAVAFNNGGTDKSSIPYGSVLIGNDKNIIINPKLNWNNEFGVFNIEGGIIKPTNNINASKLIGNGANISNILINTYNLLNFETVDNGFTGRTILPLDQILIGNDIYPLLSTDKFTWDSINNRLNIKGSILVKNIINNIVSEYKASNLVGTLPINTGGTDISFINKGYILIGNNSNTVIISSNINFINNTLNVGGKIYSKKITGTFAGNAQYLSNIYASNFITPNKYLNVINGGLGINYFKSNNILFGNENNIITSQDIYFDTNLNSLYSTNLHSTNLAAVNYYGDGSGLSNITLLNLIDSFSTIFGGTSCNIILKDRILIGNNSNSIYTTPNLIWKNDIQYNSLYVNDNIFCREGYANKLYGDGNSLSNIIHSNLINVLKIYNGGFSSNYINDNYILIGNGNNIFTTSNLQWDNLNNTLKINNTLYANNLNSTSFIGADNLYSLFIGDGLNVSNLNGSNFLNNAAFKNGGTGYNKIEKGYLLIGNKNINIVTTSNLYWDKSLYVKGDINANTFYASNMYGDGQHILNYIFYASNMISSDCINTINGGTSLKYITSNEILFGNINSTSNFKIIDDNIFLNGIVNAKQLNLKGGVIALSYEGKFFGDGISLSNIVASNLITAIPVINYGTGYDDKIPKGQLIIGNNIKSIITTSNLIYNDNIFNIKGHTITSVINISNNAIISNCVCDNINILNNSVYNNINSKNIYSSYFYGNGNNISNIQVRNIDNLNINVFNGGTGYNNIPQNELLIGSNNVIITTSNLLWNSNLIINGDIQASNIFINNIITNSSIFASKLIGDGANISNINVASLMGVVPVIYGGTGKNFIDHSQLLVGNASNTIFTTSNLLWNNQDNYLYINGIINTANINGINITSSEFNIINQLTVHEASYINFLSTKILQSKLIGNGQNISNIITSNILISSILSLSNGGTNSNILNKGTLLIGNGTSLLTSSNIIWDNDTNNLLLDGIININNINISNNSYLNSKRIYSSKYYGNGYNISNINVNNIIGSLNISYGGIGTNYIKKGFLLVGNNSNSLITTSNLTWNIDNNSASINGLINTNFLNTSNMSSSNIICNDINVKDSYHNNIYTRVINSIYSGDGANLSNIILSNIINNYTLNISNGGFGTQTIPDRCIILGNNNTTSNLLFSNNTLNIIGSLSANNIKNNLEIKCSSINSGNFIGDGVSLLNVDLNLFNKLNNPKGSSNNILLNFNNGCTGLSNINAGCLLIGNNNSLIITSNILCNDVTKILYVNNTINTNIISTSDIYSCNIICSNLFNTGSLTFFKNIVSKNIIYNNYFGNGENISNILFNSFINNIPTQYYNGGTNCNSLPLGNILMGNDKNYILTTSKLIFDSNILNIVGDFSNTSSYLNSDVNGASIFATNLYGDGKNISNIISSNIISSLPIYCCGTGRDIITKDSLLIGNNRNPVIISSNIYITETSNFNINNRINVKNIFGSNNIYTSNIITTTFQSEYIIVNNRLLTKNINCEKFYGELLGVSNLNAKNFISINSSINGGTSTSNIPKGFILLGNGINEGLNASSNLIWDIDNTLKINGDIYIKNINNNNNIFSTNVYSSYYNGDGLDISNISVTNINGIIPVTCSGTGCNYIDYGRILVGNNNRIITSSNFNWNNSLNSLAINGLLQSSNIFQLNSLITPNIFTSNLIISTDTTIANIYGNNIYSTYYGDGLNISNINNFKGILLNINGGLSLTPRISSLLYNNSQNIISSSNIFYDYDNNNLLVQGNIITSNCIVYNNINCKNLYGEKIIGDGKNISNIDFTKIIGPFNVANSGIGTNFINSGCLLIGNDTDSIKFTSNLHWDDLNGELYINSNFNTTVISAVSYSAANYITCNITVSGDSYFDYINSINIQSRFIGNGENISNIYLEKIIGKLPSISFANVDYGNIIIGNNLNNVASITSSNLSWYNNNLYTTNINTTNLKYNNLYQSNLDLSYLYVLNKYILKNIFYISLNIASISSINSLNYVPFIIEQQNSTVLNANIYWTNNYFAPPVNGLYLFDFSIATDTDCFIWINKGFDFSGNFNNGTRYVSLNGSINVMLECSVNDIIYFGIKNVTGNGRILINNALGLTKASIILLKYYDF